MGHAEVFIKRFHEDLETIEMKTEVSSAGTSGPTGKGRQGGFRQEPKKRGTPARTASDISLGLRTAVLSFAVKWLLRHCRDKSEAAAAGEINLRCHHHVVSPCNKETVTTLH
jgi:hypothetical protein